MSIEPVLVNYVAPNKRRSVHEFQKQLCISQASGKWSKDFIPDGLPLPHYCGPLPYTRCAGKILMGNNNKATEKNDEIAGKAKELTAFGYSTKMPRSPQHLAKKAPRIEALDEISECPNEALQSNAIARTKYPAMLLFRKKAQSDRKT